LLEVRDATLRIQRIESGDRIPDGPVLFERCVFEACSAGVRSDATQRIPVRGVTLRDCEVRGGGVRGLALSDSVVDGLRVKSLPQVLGCTFEHVVIRGKINQLMIRQDLPTVHDQTPFVADAERAYEAVDWALDISELDSPDFDLRGLPARLVIGDPLTQAVVTREQAEGGAWRDVDLSGTPFRVGLKMLAERDWEDYLLVAPRSGKSAARAQEVIAELVAKGIARAPRTR
jgi:hypothetical protein